MSVRRDTILKETSCPFQRYFLSFCSESFKVCTKGQQFYFAFTRFSNLACLSFLDHGMCYNCSTGGVKNFPPLSLPARQVFRTTVSLQDLLQNLRQPDAVRDRIRRQGRACHRGRRKQGWREKVQTLVAPGCRLGVWRSRSGHKRSLFHEENYFLVFWYEPTPA